MVLLVPFCPNSDNEALTFLHQWRQHATPVNVAGYLFNSQTQATSASASSASQPRIRTERETTDPQYKIHPNRNENGLDVCIQYIDTIKTLLTRSKNVLQTAVQICTLDLKDCTRINIQHMRTNSAPRIKSAPKGKSTHCTAHFQIIKDSLKQRILSQTGTEGKRKNNNKKKIPTGLKI